MGAVFYRQYNDTYVEKTEQQCQTDKLHFFTLLIAWQA